MARITTDAMSATIEEIPYGVLHKITARITAEVPGINWVCYDITPKHRYNRVGMTLCGYVVL